MKKASFPLSFVLLLLLGFAALGPTAPRAEAGQPVCAARTPPVGALPADLFDYIRGNRSRMIQVATIGFGIGLVILLTSVRKH